ncbi:mechanosensitive ion channel family protein [Corynebacterium aquilae]|uniref:mechanosensitive ion channel family protein n=1 Tax=Corynebacterium aquilae TaxID=203263 RepID=UPI000B21FE61|nr:mechanosensitive ion channel family protein [Corynebacterium aquilae]
MKLLTVEHLADKPLKIAIILLLALIGHIVFRQIVATLCRRAARGDGTRQKARLQTLSGVGKSAVAIVVWTWAGMTILSTVGINVAPLIASAGVAGVALGFGAQSLVKDFLTGIFMLIEDQYGVGDTVTIGDVTGEVEAVTLRLTTIRDIDGTRWYIRNGQVTEVGNATQEIVNARVDVPVGLSNTVEDALAAIGHAATLAANDEELKHLVAGEPVVDGVTQVETDHMVIRVHVPTHPGQQWKMKREMLARIIPALKDAQVATAYPHGVGIPHPQN